MSFSTAYSKNVPMVLWEFVSTDMGWLLEYIHGMHTYRAPGKGNHRISGKPQKGRNFTNSATCNASSSLEFHSANKLVGVDHKLKLKSLHVQNSKYLNSKTVRKTSRHFAFLKAQNLGKSIPKFLSLLFNRISLWMEVKFSSPFKIPLNRGRLER